MEKDERDRKALTVRMEPDLFNKIEQVADELDQKSAAVARNYLKLAPYVVINSNLEIKTYDGNNVMLFPVKSFELIIGALKTAPEETQREIGDNLANIININADFLTLQTFKQKIDFLKTLGWFQAVPSDYLRIPRRFGTPMIVISMVYRLVTKKRCPEWKYSTFFENLLDEKYKKQKEAVNRMQSMRDEFLRILGNYSVIYDEQNYEYYEFDKVSLVDPEIANSADQSV
jgi:hypothetical protein